MRVKFRSLTASLLSATFLITAYSSSTPATAASHTGSSATQGYWNEFVQAPLAYKLSNRPSSTDQNVQRDYAALVSFYAERDHRPVWIEDGKLSSTARRAIFFLSRSDRWGLDPEAFITPSLALGFQEPASGSEIADAEVRMSMALLAYARQAYAGRTVPRDVSENLDIRPELPDPVAAMASLADGADIVESLITFNPPDTEFEVMRQELANLKSIAAEGGWRTIGSGPTLKPGMRDDRVILLKQRFGIYMPPPIIADPEVVSLYEGEVVEAVRQYQEENGLEADGIIGPATLSQLNMSVIDRIYQILANLERWRWLPRDRGDFYVQVDVPGFRVNIVKDGEIIFTTRAVVGKPDYQTAIFSDEIEHMVVNPFWNVPRSIATEEMLPRLRNDPNYYASRDFETLDASSGQAINASAVNWSEITANNLPYRFRQRPGTGNALGNIKFMFPNRHAIYLHDTPARNLFQRTVRAYSHGCIRLYEPMAFAAALTANDPRLNLQRVQAGINSGENQTFVLANKIPIHITYITAWVEDGRINYRDDIYGHDRRVAAALNWH
jgi:L,D-transpeptidase YcbB